MKNKYFYPIFKLKAKSWIRYWLLKKTEFKGKLSEILEGSSFTLNNTLSMKFNLFEIYGNSIQDGEPSPENEVPILNSGDNGSITEKIVNENLLEITENNKLIHCTYVSGANTNEYKVLCTAPDMYTNEVQATGTAYDKTRNGNLIPCKYGETIYFDTGNSLFNKNFFTEFDENLISLGNYNRQMVSGTYTPTNSNCKYVTWRFGYGANATPGTTYTLAPIVSKTPIDSYIAHKEQTYTIPVQQPMRSIRDVRDCFVKKSDGWYERHYIGKVVLDGTESWGIRNQGDGSTTISFNHNMTNLGSTDLICNKFTQSLSSTNGVEGIGIPSQLIQIYIQIKRDRLTSLDVLGITTWLSENNVLLDYILATPLDLPCTEEQIEILENPPKTYAGQTNIYSPDEVKPFLKIQYWESDTNG